MINANLNINGASRGKPYPTAGLDVIVYTDTYEVEGTTYYKTSTGVGLDVIGQDTDGEDIINFAPLNDARFDKGSYVGNAYGLPEYYYGNYVDVYFNETSEATRYHWKLSDFNYLILEREFKSLTNCFFAKADYTAEIFNPDKILIYSSNQAQNLDRIKSYANITHNINWYDITPSNYNDYGNGAEDDWVARNDTVKSVEDGAVKFTYGTSASLGYRQLRASAGLFTDTYKSIKYKIEIEAKVIGGSAKVTPYTGSAYGDSQDLTSEYKTYILEIIPTTTASSGVFFDNATGGSVYIRNMKVEIYLEDIFLSYSATAYDGEPQYTAYVRSTYNTSYYYQYRIGRELDLSEIKYLDMYRIGSTSLQNLSTGRFVNEGDAYISGSGTDNIFVYKRAGKNDFTGGIHGDELQTSFVIKIDDVDIASTLPGSSEFLSGSKLQFVQESTLHETSNDGINHIVDHPLEANHTQIVTIDRDGLIVNNEVVWQKNITDFNLVYINMATIVSSYFDTVTDNLGNSITLVGDEALKINSFATFVNYTNSENKNKVYVKGENNYNSENTLLKIWDQAANAKFYRDLTNNGEMTEAESGDTWTSTTTVKTYLDL